MSNLSHFKHQNISSITFSDVFSRYEFISLLPDDAQLDMIPNSTYLQELPNFLYTPKTFDLSDLIFEYNNSFEGDVDEPLEHVFEDQAPTLVSFFASQMIDIPLCFKKSKSLHYVSAADPQVRFVNMLTKHGRRAYAARIYTLSLHHIANLFQKKLIDEQELLQWRSLHAGFIRSKYSHAVSTFKQPVLTLEGVEDPLLDLRLQEHEPENYTVSENDWVRKLFYEELEEYKPVFSFYIRKVDKMKRKHSRGKSGTYTISWKYVPHYKRILMVLRWLVKDIRFQKPKTFHQRVATSLETLLFSKKSHLVYQLRQFVHRFAYQSYKKTLLKTLRSTS